MLGGGRGQAGGVGGKGLYLLGLYIDCTTNEADRQMAVAAARKRLM